MQFPNSAAWCTGDAFAYVPSLSFIRVLWVVCTGLENKDCIRVLLLLVVLGHCKLLVMPSSCERLVESGNN